MRLINADALTEKYGDWYTEEGTEEGYIGTIKGIVESMPTIEERKKGKWIDEGQYADFFPHHAYRCSECGHHLIEIEVAYDFCPFCGADMREGNQ